MQTADVSCFSFTISTWVYMAADYPTTPMPIVCNDDATLCLYLKDRLGILSAIIVFKVAKSQIVSHGILGTFDLSAKRIQGGMGS